MAINMLVNTCTASHTATGSTNGKMEALLQVTFRTASSMVKANGEAVIMATFMKAITKETKSKELVTLNGSQATHMLVATI